MQFDFEELERRIDCCGPLLAQAIRETEIYRSQRSVLAPVAGVRDSGVARYNLSVLVPSHAEKKWDEMSLGLEEDLRRHYRGGRLLDVCCGIGQNLYVAIKRKVLQSADAYGVDINPSNIETWHFHYRNVFDLEHLPFPAEGQIRVGDALKLENVFNTPDRFAYLVANYCLENIGRANAPQFAAALAKQTAAGGRLYLITFESSSEIVRQGLVDGYSPDELRTFFGRWFEIEDISVEGFLNTLGQTQSSIRFTAVRNSVSHFS